MKEMREEAKKGKDNLLEGMSKIEKKKERREANSGEVKSQGQGKRMTQTRAAQVQSQMARKTHCGMTVQI